MRLLEVTQDNYDKISSEKWFERVVYTLTGKNKKLTEINKSNLLEIQKIAVVFLIEYSNQNRKIVIMMEEAFESIGKLVDNTKKLSLEQIKLKYFIKKTLEKNQDLEKRVEELEKKNDKNILKKVYRQFANTIKINHSKELLKENESKKKEGYNTESLKSDIKEEIGMILTYIAENVSYKSIIFIIENIEPYNKFVDFFNGERERQKVSEMAENIINYLPISQSMLEESVSESINEFVGYIKGFNKEFIDNHTLKRFNTTTINISYSDKSKINQNCSKNLSKARTEINKFLDIRQSLLNRLPRFLSIMNESYFIAFMKGFAEGAIPVWGQFAAIDGIFFEGNIKEELAKRVGIKTDNVYMDEFIDDLWKMMQLYQGIVNKCENLIYAVVYEEIKLYIESFINNYDIILDRFVEYGINLEDVNNYCLELIEEIEQEED